MYYVIMFGVMKSHHLPVWWNWQTRRTQNPKVAIPCRFDPDYRHQKKNQLFAGSFLFISKYLKIINIILTSSTKR